MLGIAAIGWRGWAPYNASDRISHVAKRPTRTRVIGFVALAGIATLACAGA